MQVKKFTGSTTPQVMAQIRREFGNDAIILQTNKVKVGGIFGFFAKEQIEILAAVDDNQRRTIATAQRKEYSDLNNTNFKNHLEKLNEISKTQKEDQATDQLLSKAQTNRTRAVKTQDENENFYGEKDAGTEKLAGELDEMKTTLNKLSKKINDTFKTEEEEIRENEIKDNIKKLVDVGVSEEFAGRIISNISEKEQGFTFENVVAEIKNRFSEIDFSKVVQESKSIVFVGSTGIGKTTTLAKLASKYMLGGNKKIGFLTLDTYRISAVEQLKTYADILSSPIEVAYEIDDLETALQRLSNRDRIYVDTSGRSHHNKKQMQELQQIIDKIEDKTIYLILPANINVNDAFDIIKMYEFLPEYGIIITKLDETNKTGVILDIINKTGKNISYVTFGQSVPDDIEQFDFNIYLTELLKEMFK